MRYCLRVCALIMACAVSFWGVIPAASASSVLMAKELSKGKASAKEAPLPDPDAMAAMPPDTVDDLLARLTDAQVRQLLQETVHRNAQARLSATATAPPTLEEQLVATSTAMKTSIHGALAALPSLPADLHAALTVLAGPQGLSGLALQCLGVLLVLLTAWQVERLTGRQLRRARHRAASAEDLAAHLPRFRRILAELVGAVSGLLVFVLTALGLYSLCFDPAWTARPLTTGLLAAGGGARIVWVALRWLLAPGRPDVRLVPLGDTAARAISLLLLTLLGLSLLRLHVLQALAHAGMAPTSLTLLRGLIGLAGMLLLIGATLFHRKPVAAWLLTTDGDTPGPLRRQFAAVWHMLAILYILGMALVWYALLLLQGFEGSRGVLLAGLLAVPAFLLLDRLGYVLLRRIFTVFQRRPSDTATPPKLDDDGQPVGEVTVIKAEPLPDVETMRFFGPLRAWVRALLLGFLGAAMAEAWGMGTALTQAVVGHGLGIMLILAVSLGLWEAAKAGMQRALQPKNQSEQENPRINTLLPLMQKVLGVFLLLSTLLMILSQLGVQIAPLLASAGVFGLAIGMGSQTLVKDVVAGVFFLLDDAFRVGDYIQMGKTEGYVIKMSVRNITMQHTLGYVQILPFGQIKDVVNYSRNPIVMKIKIPLPMETDPKLFKKICKKVNASIMADEEFKNDLVEPIKSQGVKRIEDSVMIFGIKYMTKPGKQFAIRREVFSRLYKEFKKYNLSFAAPGVTVYTAGKGGEEEAAAASAAARMKAQAQQQAEQAGEG
ncbi:putative MscS Mechanosensitive ion channel [Megalodesulfovibrio gigas DSM 1382 = ATCC 19364]|uniref:Putative MscS Mechanosensitive ion channel n=2 Tax=Megalodesulfovibrio gigas TaxID=879 RepID=T2G9T3_MEGG1|nr:putative MscS Mechanosensitive ion channel [Megalodesulfovibrio gigas DSM 1382 = ATCC 19364]